MIPKTIHTAWFGPNSVPDIFNKNLRSWKKFCPDYKIQIWNESNYKISKYSYLEKTYNQKKYAFLTDFLRLVVVYEYGGIWLDIDVELVKSLDGILSYDGFFAFSQYRSKISTGLGFEAVKKNGLIQKLIKALNHHQRQKM
jgi:mannosyltransferase OCH1-like enzyme